MNYKLNAERTVAIDLYVRFYPIETCPTGVKVQLLTIGGIAIYGRLSSIQGSESYQGWRPVPAGLVKEEQ